MGFFSDLKEDLSQAVNELMPEEDLNQGDVAETKEQPVKNMPETTEKVQTEQPTDATKDNAALEEMLKNLDLLRSRRQMQKKSLWRKQKRHRNSLRKKQRWIWIMCFRTI